MKQQHFRIWYGMLIALATLCLVGPSRAQFRPDGGPRPPGATSAQMQPTQMQPAQMPQAQLRPAEVAEAPAARAPGDASTPSSGAASPVSVTAHPEREMSPWSMFLAADILVKVVMICLAFASLATWTIFLAMSIQLALARRRLGEALSRIADARTLAEAQLGLGPARNVLSSLLAAAMHELRLSADSPAEGGIKERVSIRFSEIVRTEARAMRHGMGILATIGSTSPFVGLFGTVWGIMNSFIGISKSQTTNLAVVAPGIAEALLATAIGLVAAIPAVIIYNHFSRTTKGYLDLVRRASGTIGRLLSRDIDRSYGRMASRAAE
jgi:biopolymer transport protein ExbB